ncbi:MAG: S41 family peptidase [Sediminibacterium sp.]|nr:S41 family peptidase [Sediminibacterium sp.]
MRNCFLLLGLLLGLSIPTIAQRNSNTFKKIAPAQQRADMELLKKILEANHPSLYWYSSKNRIDSTYEFVYNQLTDSINEIDFRNKIAYWLNEIKCGHTVVRFSKATSKQVQKNKTPLFPLQIKVWNDSLVVLANTHQKDSVLKRGTIIQSINGIPNIQLTDSIFKYIATDGYANNHKNQLLSNAFPFWYANTFGIDSAYTIEYIDSTGQKNTTIIPHVYKDSLTINSSKSKAARTIDTSSYRISKRQQLQLSRRSLLIDTAAQTAYMRLNTFSRGGLRRFFRKSFKQINSQSIQNLVIDLRNNGGGKVNNSIRLTQYLIDHPFKIGDSVVATSRKFTYGRYIQSSWIYWLAMNFAASKENDGSIHYKRYEQHYYEPISRNHYNGNIYLVQGGYTFSASTMFIAALKGQKNTTVIGEETGGGYYGNSAMHIPTIVLPNSKIRVSLPMYRLVMDRERVKGRGIMPDLNILPSSHAIKMGVDPKMIAVKQLIQSKH